MAWALPVKGGPFDGAVWEKTLPMVSNRGHVYRAIRGEYEYQSMRAWQCLNCGAFITPGPRDVAPACFCGTPRHQSTEGVDHGAV